MDPRSDRTSVVRSRLMNILSLRMQVNSSSATLKSPTSNAHSSLPPTDESVKGISSDGSPPLPQVPPIRSDSSEHSDATRRALTPIIERASVSERDPSLSLISGAAVANSPEQNNSSTPAPNEDRGQELVLEVPISTSPAQISPPSVYAPTETFSIPIEPSRHSRELSREASVANRSLESTTPFTGSVSGERPLINDNRPSDVRVASPASVHSVHSSAASPPSLSPANSSNPPASLSPTQAVPRTPSPRFSILTSPHSMVDSPRLMGHSFVELGSSGDRSPLSPQSVTPPAALRAAVLPPPKFDQILTQTNQDMPREETHDISDVAGALYYIHELDQESVETNPQPPESDNRELSSETDSDIPQAPQYIQPIITPLRPKGASPPPQRTSPRSLPHVDTSQLRRPPNQPIPRTPTLDSGGPDRRPAGARAAPGSNRQDASTWGIQPPRNLSIRSDRNIESGNMSHLEDPDADALAALTFLERHEHGPLDVPVSVTSSPPTAISPLPQPHQLPPAIVEPEMRFQTSEFENASAYRSSFAPSKNAMQRKARTEAQQAAHEAATHRPGRASGRTKNRHKPSGVWGDSSEEEEEEEEEDDEDVDSDGQPTAPRDDRSVSNYAPSANQRSQYSSPRGPSPLPSGDAPSNQVHTRPPRNLPPVPTARGQSMSLVLPVQCVLILTILSCRPRWRRPWTPSSRPVRGRKEILLRRRCSS
jgi:CCR4-NOT transcriptional complex subunit CAF120